jgi:hypothetical protein
MAAFFGAMPSSVTVPFTSPAVAVSTFCPVGVAEGEDGSLDVLDVPLFPPPHAATVAASVMSPKAFRKCIDFS